jgi:hypothetical protein
MTFDAVDKLLADWKARLDRASENLVALTQLTPYQRLRGENGWPKLRLTGVTAARVEPAFAQLGDLWTLYGQLHDVVGRAAALRTPLSRLLASKKTLDEIEALLTGPSVRLPTVATPLHLRGLCSEAEIDSALTPEQALRAMTDAFTTARDAVQAVGAAWDRWTVAATDLESEAKVLADRAAALGEPVPPELAAVNCRLAVLRDCIDHDPLAADADLAALTHALGEIRARLDGLTREREKVRAELTAAHALCSELEQVHQQALRARDERLLKIETDDAREPALLAEEALAAVTAWWGRLEETVKRGRFQAAHVGLDRWTTAARQYLTQDRAALAADEAAIRERLNLRGLLDALKAKARASGRAEDLGLAALAEEAQALLQRRPTPMPRARQLIDEYQQRLL